MIVSVSAPMIDVIQNSVCSCLSVFQDQVFFYPCYKVILKCSFYYLMKQVGGNQFMDISPRKIIRKWLGLIRVNIKNKGIEAHYDIQDNTIITP
jgi:hypothetical protein